MNWVRAMWRRMHCTHPAVKGIHGDERRYGYRWRCRACGFPTNKHTDPAHRVRGAE